MSFMGRIKMKDGKVDIEGIGHLPEKPANIEKEIIEKMKEINPLLRTFSVSKLKMALEEYKKGLERIFKNTDCKQPLNKLSGFPKE